MRKYIGAFMVLGAVLLGGCSSASSVSRMDVFLEGHLNKLKGKNYEGAYADFSIAAKEAFSFSKYLQLQKLIKNKLGNLESYERIGHQKRIGLGSRGPTSTVLTYKTKYSNEEAVSTFIVISEEGKSKIYHYHINSLALASEELRRIFESNK